MDSGDSKDILVSLLSITPLPQYVVGGIAHSHEELVVAQGLHDPDEEHLVAIGDDAEVDQVVLREGVVLATRLLDSLIQGLLPDGEFGSI